jgi:hypothetical protein
MTITKTVQQNVTVDHDAGEIQVENLITYVDEGVFANTISQHNHYKTKEEFLASGVPDAETYIAEIGW